MTYENKTCLQDRHPFRALKVKKPVFKPLRKSEVGELEMSVLVEQEILGFEVAIDDRQRVEIVESGRDLGGVEQTRAVGELSGIAQVRE